MDDEDEFKIPDDDEVDDGEEEDPLAMEGFHEEGVEPETDF